MSFHRSRTAAGLLAVVALAATAMPAAAQEDANPSFTPEEMEKMQAFVEFFQNAGEWLPTVNQIDPAGLPVSFPFEDLLNHATVQVAYGDGEPLQFMFDTGAATLVTPEVAETYGGDVLVETMNQAGGGVIFFTPLQEYPDMTVEGELVIEKPTGQTPWDAAGEFQCFARDGLLGATAMANAVWQVDYGTGQIAVASSTDQLDHIDGAIAVPFTRAPGLSPTPHVQLGAGDGVLDIIVDTGGGIPLTISADSLARVGVEVPADSPAVSGLGHGAAGSFEVRGLYTSLPITYGETEMVTPISVAAGFAPGADGNMGHLFLKNFVVTFDYLTDTMYLEPLAEDAAVRLDDPSAASVSWNDGLVVGGLPDGSPAAAAGLTPGETIIAIDGASVEDFTLDDYCAFKIAGERPSTITTATGTYEAGRMEGFFKSLEQ